MAGFMMISMSVVHSASLYPLQRRRRIIRYEPLKNSVFQKVPDTTHTSFFMISGCPYLLFYDDFNVCRAFCMFQPDSTLNEFSVLSVLRELDLSKVAMKT